MHEGVRPVTRNSRRSEVSRQTVKREASLRLKDIIDRATAAARRKRPRIAVAGAHDEIVLEVVCDAAAKRLVSPLLFGDAERIRDIAKRKRLALGACEVVDVADPKLAARQAVEAARSGGAEILMKGVVTTATLMKAALDEETGIKTQRLMSHVALIEPKSHGRVFLMTDGGIVIEPDVVQKVGIVRNAIEVAHALGIAMPRVALLSSIEVVNLKMRSAVDAAIISKMADRGEIKGAVVDGPLAFDNAVSSEAARQKGISSPVAGRADILVVGHADVGNVMYKALTYFCGDQVKTAGVIVGGRVPMVVVSRADTYEARFNSIAVACVLAAGR
ncbi:MAG: bifunctional enoyl-CoA hydratase/phosphate acetyltransferase [bacterium]